MGTYDMYDNNATYIKMGPVLRSTQIASDRCGQTLLVCWD